MGLRRITGAGVLDDYAWENSGFIDMVQRHKLCTNQYNKTNVMHFCSMYEKLRASTCFEHCLLIFRRRCPKGT
jgi:hypothetical protein